MWQHLWGQYLGQQGMLLHQKRPMKHLKPQAYRHFIGIQSIKFQTSPLNDVEEVAGTRSEGRTDESHYLTSSFSLLLKSMKGKG